MSIMKILNRLYALNNKLDIDWQLICEILFKLMWGIGVGLGLLCIGMVVTLMVGLEEGLATVLLGIVLALVLIKETST